MAADLRIRWPDFRTSSWGSSSPGSWSQALVRTFNARLLHPPTPRPPIVYFHVAVFTSWIILFLLQSALIATGNVKLHRKVGAARFRARRHARNHGGGSFYRKPKILYTAGPRRSGAVSRHFAERYDRVQRFLRTGDLLAEEDGIPSPLDVYRHMHAAECAHDPLASHELELTRNNWIYVGVDALILLGWGRDWIINKRIHPVYLYGLPAALLGQLIALHLDLSPRRHGSR